MLGYFLGTLTKIMHALLPEQMHEIYTCAQPEHDLLHQVLCNPSDENTADFPIVQQYVSSPALPASAFNLKGPNQINHLQRSEPQVNSLADLQPSASLSAAAIDQFSSETELACIDCELPPDIHFRFPAARNLAEEECSGSDSPLTPTSSKSLAEENNAEWNADCQGTQVNYLHSEEFVDVRGQRLQQTSDKGQ